MSESDVCRCEVRINLLNPVHLDETNVRTHPDMTLTHHPEKKAMLHSKSFVKLRKKLRFLPKSKSMRELMLDRWETPLEVKEVDLHKSKTERLLQAFDNVSQILSASILRHEPKYKARNEEALELMMSESSRVPIRVR